MATLQWATSGTVSGLQNNQQGNDIAGALATLSQGASAPTTSSTGLSTTAGFVWHDTGNNLLKLRDQADANWMPFASVDETNKIVNPYGVIPQCGRLAYVSATGINFAPRNGNFVMIAGSLYQIPSAGVSAANTSVYVNGVSGQNLAASTLYYVYLFNNAGTLTVDFSTTAHATDTATGVEIKSGDNTRTLIGMIYTNLSSQFSDSAALRQVASWFNRRARAGQAATGNVSGFSTNGSYAGVGGSAIAAVMWADEDLFANVSGYFMPPAQPMP